MLRKSFKSLSKLFVKLNIYIHLKSFSKKICLLNDMLFKKRLSKMNIVYKSPS